MFHLLGGLIFTLADTAFACACNSFGPVTVAASADIVFVAPARAGDVLVAEAVRDGDIRSDADATLTARLLFGLVNSIVEWYRPDRRSTALADQVCAMAFDGLRARRP